MSGESLHTIIATIGAYRRLAAALDTAHAQARILAHESLDPRRRKTLLRMTSDLYDMKRDAENTVESVRRENARGAS